MHEADREFPPPVLRTLPVHAGADRTSPVRPLTPPLELSTVYAFHDSPLADARFAADEPIYARDGLPTVRTLERAVAALEGAEDAHAVASGMAAISLTMLALLAAGDHVVVARDGYRDTEALLTQQLARFGVVASAVDLDDPRALETTIRPATRLVFVETISNPGWRCAICRRWRRSRGAPASCSASTTPSPRRCSAARSSMAPISSSTAPRSSSAAHHDLTAGVVCGRRDLIEQIRRSGYLFGPTLGPFDAWLALRGLKTLAPRIAWASETAARVADFLAAHPAVAGVRYPGKPAPSRADLTRRLLPHGAGAMLAFAPRGGPPAADAVIRALRLIAYAPSLGGTETIASYPPQPEGFARRRSTGAADLPQCVDPALDRAGGRRGRDRRSRSGVGRGWSGRGAIDDGPPPQPLPRPRGRGFRRAVDCATAGLGAERPRWRRRQRREPLPRGRGRGWGGGLSPEETPR